MSERLVLGTRGSQLAMAQSGQVARQLEAASGGAVSVELRVISTKGDRVQDRPLPEVGGKGLFTAELEAALRDGGIDLAVHSLKDLPTENPDGLILGCCPPRQDPRDVLVGGPLGRLAEGAVVGTGSARRRAQLLTARPDLDVRGIRGNVDTRLRKLAEGAYDAIVLAAAGLNRLGLTPDGAPLDPSVCLPAPGQGALGVQCRDGDERVLALLRSIDDGPSRACVAAERAFLRTLEGGCSVPAGALAVLEGDTLWLRALLADDAGRVHRAEGRVSVADGPALGRRLASELRAAAS